MLDLLLQISVFTIQAVSHSMEPTILIGDLYTTDQSIPLDTLEIGDIIAFRTPNPEVLPEDSQSEATTHRIIDINRDEDTGIITEITTKGDNDITNPESIKGIDLTPDISRDRLLELYIGKVTLGQPTQEQEIRINTELQIAIVEGAQEQEQENSGIAL